jgi:hypothetical protein
MKLRFVELKVALRERGNIVPKSVPAWEVPVLEAVHMGNGSVQMVEIVRELVAERREGLSSVEEFARLERKYGTNPEGVAWVGVIYGQHQMGVQALKTAMLNSVLPEETPVTPPRVQPKLAADVATAIKPDVVAGLEQERQLAQQRIAAREAAEREAAQALIA